MHYFFSIHEPQPPARFYYLDPFFLFEKQRDTNPKRRTLPLKNPRPIIPWGREGDIVGIDPLYLSRSPPGLCRRVTLFHPARTAAPPNAHSGIFVQLRHPSGDPCPPVFSTPCPFVYFIVDMEVQGRRETEELKLDSRINTPEMSRQLLGFQNVLIWVNLIRIRKLTLAHLMGSTAYLCIYIEALRE